MTGSGEALDLIRREYTRANRMRTGIVVGPHGQDARATIGYNVPAMRDIHRILDANLNRAREALRVIEDFARFVLDDASIASSAKGMRSRLQQAAATLPAEALLAGRDTPGDVGTALTSPTEGRRADAAGVAVAACKRLTEALRTLEEYAKVDAATAPTAGAFEALRYDAYTLEKRLIGRTDGPGRFEAIRLYVLLTTGLCKGDPLDVAAAAIDGGADCIQLREKLLPDRGLLALALRLRKLTSDADVMMIVNDRPDIAAAVGADGVHLGQDDLPISAARRVLAPRMIVGRSTHTLDQARAASAEAADYIAVGPMFATATKDAGPIAGIETFAQVAAEITRPLIVIGGIDAGNVESLVTAGVSRVAACSAVIAAEDPAAAARAIKDKLPA